MTPTNLLINDVAMVTHNFNKLLPFLFNMNTLVSDQSSPMTYTSRFCVAMLAAFAIYNPSEAALTVLSGGMIILILNTQLGYIPKYSTHNSAMFRLILTQIEQIA